MCHIWNISEAAEVACIKLDLEDKLNLKEDPKKLMYLNLDNLVLFLREERTGVKMISLTDGTYMGSILQIHKNPILCILATKDKKCLITSGRDKKIKVTDWMSQKTIATLQPHKDIIQVIVLTPNQTYLISGADDNSVALFH